MPGSEDGSETELFQDTDWEMLRVEDTGGCLWLSGCCWSLIYTADREGEELQALAPPPSVPALPKIVSSRHQSAVLSWELCLRISRPPRPQKRPSQQCGAWGLKGKESEGSFEALWIIVPGVSALLASEFRFSFCAGVRIARIGDHLYAITGFALELWFCQPWVDSSLNKHQSVLDCGNIVDPRMCFLKGGGSSDETKYPSHLPLRSASC